MKEKVRVVPKAWGREEIFVNGEEYCGKVMRLQPGWRCSLHYHPTKRETFLVLGGVMGLEVGDDHVTLVPGEAYTIRPGIHHRFTNMGLRECVFVEVSTFDDPEDVVRLAPSEPVMPEVAEVIESPEVV